MSRPPPPLAPSGAAALFARHLREPARAWVSTVCAETARAHATQRAPVSPGYLAFKLAVGLGYPMAFASRAGAVLDALQPMIDLADNLADEALDLARGLRLDARYPGVPREALHGLPALMTGAVLAALHEDFPTATHRTTDAARRVLDVLSRMVEGQGQALDDPARVDNIAGQQAVLLCLPLWLRPDDVTPPARIDDIERWAFRYGRLWQLRVDVAESHDPAAARARFSEAIRQTRAVWPCHSPFTTGCALAPERLLPREHT